MRTAGVRGPTRPEAVHFGGSYGRRFPILKLRANSRLRHPLLLAPPRDFGIRSLAEERLVAAVQG